MQECQLQKDKIIDLTGFSGITKSSPEDNATGGVTLYINKSVLFSEIKLDTDLQVVVVSPKGGRGCLMSAPCLESQGCHLIPLCYHLSCSSA